MALRRSVARFDYLHGTLKLLDNGDLFVEDSTDYELTVLGLRETVRQLKEMIAFDLDYEKGEHCSDVARPFVMGRIRRNNEELATYEPILEAIEVDVGNGD